LNAFTTKRQRFQVTDSDGRVLCELEEDRFRVFDTVAEEDVPAAVGVLAMLTDAVRFTRFINLHRGRNKKENDEKTKDLRVRDVY